MPEPVTQFTRLLVAVKQSLPATGRSIDTQFQIWKVVLLSTRSCGMPLSLSVVTANRWWRPVPGALYGVYLEMS
ncbi:hypothetical protein D3C71_2118830 [compost metagenome]